MYNACVHFISFQNLWNSNSCSSCGGLDRFVDFRSGIGDCKRRTFIESARRRAGLYFLTYRSLVRHMLVTWSQAGLRAPHAWHFVLYPRVDTSESRARSDVIMTSRSKRHGVDVAWVKWNKYTSSECCHAVRMQWPRSLPSRVTVSSSLQITNRSFTYASPYLWNRLPSSFRQPHSVHSPLGSPHPYAYHLITVTIYHSLDLSLQT